MFYEYGRSLLVQLLKYYSDSLSPLEEQSGTTRKKVSLSEHLQISLQELYTQYKVWLMLLLTDKSKVCFSNRAEILSDRQEASRQSRRINSEQV